MRRLELDPPAPPPLEDVPFKSLYRKETYHARTGDGWVLRITRYRPLPQPWRQPLLRLMGHAATPANLQHLDRFQLLARKLGVLLNPARAAHEDVRWLLRRGGEKEPRKVLEQFARWVRHGEMVCYRTGFDYQKNFHRIQAPLVILYGDRDKIGSRRSTFAVARGAGSEYRVWRALRENSHLELTMGADVQESCAAVRDLVAFVRAHERSGVPAPRREPARVFRLRAPPPIRPVLA